MRDPGDTVIVRYLVNHDRVQDLMRSGVYSGCVAILTNEEAGEATLNHLSEKARQRYRSVRVFNLDKESPEQLALCDAELVVVHGFEQCSPQRPETFAARSALETRRYKGLFAILCLNRAAFRHHFCNPAHPFYHFCGEIEQGQISDLIDGG